MFRKNTKSSIFIYILLLSSLLFLPEIAYPLFVFHKLKDNIPTVENNIDMALTKDYIDKFLPQLAVADDYHKAVILRNFVYVNGGQYGNNSFTLPVTYESFLQYVRGEINPLCGALSMVYIALLDLYGIPSHLVDLSTNDVHEQKAINDTHVAVEVYVDGVWILQDPTFNIHWRQEGKSLDTLGLLKAFSSEKEPIPDSDGYATDPKRTVENYYLPYKRLLEHIRISRYIVWGPTPCAGRQAVEMEWPAIVDQHDLLAKGSTILSYDFSSSIPAEWIISDNAATQISYEIEKNPTEFASQTNIANTLRNFVDISSADASRLVREGHYDLYEHNIFTNHQSRGVRTKTQCQHPLASNVGVRF